jgi:hemoglobin-like flavoprotein
VSVSTQCKSIEDSELIHASLEMAAKNSSDLTPGVYRRFFQLAPDALDLFGPVPDQALMGHMLNAIIFTFLDMVDGKLNPTHVQTWALDHRMWSVEEGMFPAMFSAVVDAVSDAVGPAWTARHAEAWDRQINFLLEIISSAYAIPINVGVKF